MDVLLGLRLALKTQGNRMGGAVENCNFILPKDPGSTWASGTSSVQGLTNRGTCV